ncbi:pirin-like C-terminal cupin domain-containing protein [Streptomyces sp. NPDC056638]|uniref:pirin-like C-terminal cupin domain-containing protein n=1 Tax=Streptomyces sp. NPDC056638 TaxID=3345887 RepID=UPI0036791BE0
MPGARLRPDFNALACALTGLGSVGEEQRPARMGQLAVYGGCDMVTGATDAGQDSRSPQLEMLVLGGEPVAVYGPFVMNTRQELYKASVDYGPGRRRSSPSGLRRGAVAALRCWTRSPARVVPVSVVRAVSCGGRRSPRHEPRA